MNDSERMESTTRAAWFEFEREYVGLPNERWTMYGKSIDHVAVGVPDSFASLACVLSGSADSFDGLTFSAARVNDGDTLLTMMRGARVIVPRAAGALIARAIDMLIYDGFQVCMDRHKRVLESFAKLARVFDVAMFLEHFAPVLRWTHGERESTATLGRWRLSATDGAWSVGVVAFEWVGPVDGSRGPTTRASNCSAAETSLRSLGVTFRTEGGQ